MTVIPASLSSAADAYTQTEYQIRCEWGIRGVFSLASITDVLSVTTSLDIAVACPYLCRDTSVYPCAVRLHDNTHE
ncbi:MAG TPA: hypothetical protein EYQ20_17390 [candidate division Zixibacteria bacterium]|nr:hypothetical protein [candidate division Zixibacteria bacterium]